MRALSIARFHVLPAAALVLVGGTFSAAASTFQVNPVQLYLGPGKMSALLTIQNQSSDTLRFQITTNSWGQSPRGDMELGPTEDVVFFPALLTVEPGKSRNIRVAVPKGAEAVEKTYRIFVKELPPAEKPAVKENRSEVRVLTRMGIPIFVQPAKIARSGSIDKIRMDGGSLKFEVRNGGNVAFTLGSVRVEGTSEDGASTFAKESTGWYVLAGGVREYEIPLPAADCRRTKRLSVVASTDRNTYEASLEVAPEACGSAPQ